VLDAQAHRQALAGTPIGSPFVCQLPDGSSLKIDLQTHYSVSR